ncbi:MAG: hypothetical protein RR365_01035 [Bacteroides sp.]
MNPVIRLDNMSGTKDGTLLRSIKFYDGSKAVAINNGTIVELEGLVDGEREIFKAKAPSAANLARNKIALVAAPEKDYDERKKNLDEFSNPQGTPARAYILHDGDQFAITSDGFEIGSGVTVAKGYVVELKSGSTKPVIVATATASTTKIGEVSDIETVGTKKFYTVLVG